MYCYGTADCLAGTMASYSAGIVPLDCYTREGRLPCAALAGTLWPSFMTTTFRLRSPAIGPVEKSYYVAPRLSSASGSVERVLSTFSPTLRLLRYFYTLTKVEAFLSFCCAFSTVCGRTGSSTVHACARVRRCRGATSPCMSSAALVASMVRRSSRAELVAVPA